MQRRTDNGTGMGPLGGDLRLRSVMTGRADIVDNYVFVRTKAMVGRRIPPPQRITMTGTTTHPIDAVMGGINDRGLRSGSHPKGQGHGDEHNFFKHCISPYLWFDEFSLLSEIDPAQTSNYYSLNMTIKQMLNSIFNSLIFIYILNVSNKDNPLDCQNRISLGSIDHRPDNKMPRN